MSCYNVQSGDRRDFRNPGRDVFRLEGVCSVCVSALIERGEHSAAAAGGAASVHACIVLELGSQNDGIVGFWKVKFIAEGNAGIPDGTVLDNAFVQWHSDGTEMMNSSRAPVTQSFCMGVWQKTGKSSYELNHFALTFDTSNNFVGPAQVQEDVTLDKKADQYTGTFEANFTILRGT